MKTLIPLLTITLLLAACSPQQPVADTPLPDALARTSSSTASIQPINLDEYVIEEVATNLTVPWAMAFTSDDRMLITERTGTIRVMEKSVLNPTPLHIFPDVPNNSEEGLMGLAVDPLYEVNGYIYVCLAYEDGRALKTKVLRLKDETDRLSGETTLIDNIPAAQYHAGCALNFGPDGKLYITTGDATDQALAQNVQSLAGKILRINPDGTLPDSNPFPNSPVWSYGHRNPQGLDWSKDGELHATEHGPSGFDGPGGGDEVNRIIKGGNYGWPLVSHGKRREGTIDALAIYTPAEAPGSGTFYTSDAMPALTGSFFFGALRGEGLWRLVFENGKVAHQEKLFKGTYGRIRAITVGWNGWLYFATSNTDGRGDERKGDDKILRMRKK